MKTVFVLPSLPDPRLQKRIEFFAKFGQVVVCYWNKQSFDCFERTDFHDVSYVEFSCPAPFDKPLKRIKQTIKFSFFLRKVLRHGGYDLLDVQGLDLLFASLILTGKQRFKILYEIADLHYLLIEKRSWVENIVGHFLRLIEKKMIKRVTALLLTSKRYYDIYYANLIDIKRVVFFPNIPDVSVFDGYSPKRGGVFTVGYIGSVRFERQLIMLVDVCEKLRIDVMIAGIDHAGIITKYCEGKQFVKNLGKFNYNEQIADIYGMCDCVYSVYDSSVKNVRVALPNKLYEAVKCSLPIIVSKGTYLSEVVDNWGVGCAVDCDSAEDLEAVLSKIMSKGTVYKNYVMKCDSMKYIFDIEQYNSLIISKLGICDQSNEV